VGIVDGATRQQLIVTYREGPRLVREAVAGLSDALLDARPDPEEWTAREIAHHLADSEATSYIRLRRLLAEDAPLIQAYDEVEFARRLSYDRPIAVSLDVLDAVRRSSAELLDRLDEGQWSRAGTHSESGPYGVEDWLRIYAAHAHDHADQIRRAVAQA
jgi:hypothetical protein